MSPTDGTEWHSAAHSPIRALQNARSAEKCLKIGDFGHLGTVFKAGESINCLPRKIISAGAISCYVGIKWMGCTRSNIRRS